MSVSSDSTGHSQFSDVLETTAFKTKVKVKAVLELSKVIPQEHHW